MVSVAATEEHLPVKEQVQWATDPEGGRLFLSKGNTHLLFFFFVWCQFLCKLSVSLLYPSGGGFSMVKVSQSVSIVCRSCGVKGVILLKRDAQTVLSYLLSLSPLQGSICCLPLFHWCSRSATTLGSTAMRGSRLLQP